MSTSLDIEKTCREVLAKVLSVTPDQITEDASPDTLHEWDSLAHVQIIVGLEKAFSIEISPDDSLDLESYKLILDHLNHALAVKAG